MQCFDRSADLAVGTIRSSIQVDSQAITIRCALAVITNKRSQRK
jgi:hypothetical protein